MVASSFQMAQDYKKPEEYMINDKDNKQVKDLKRYKRLANLLEILKKNNVCVLPNLEAAFKNGIESDMFWFEIFDENLKEYNGKNKY
jgi:hypothetical protein